VRCWPVQAYLSYNIAFASELKSLHESKVRLEPKEKGMLTSA